jgi:hypothetical protein
MLIIVISNIYSIITIVKFFFADEFSENYEFGVSNAWNATKHFINVDIASINAFKKKVIMFKQLIVNIKCFTPPFS